MKNFYRLILCASFIAFVALMGLGIGTAVAGGPPALMTAADSKAHAANNEGIEHYNQEHWDVALGHFKKAVEADPGSAERTTTLRSRWTRRTSTRKRLIILKWLKTSGKTIPTFRIRRSCWATSKC